LQRSQNSISTRFQAAYAAQVTYAAQVKGVNKMPSQNQKAAQTIRQTKQDLTAEQRVQGWQQARVQQGLSGEFAVAAKLGVQAASEEQIKWIADMYGR
jgi:hypothetical protein